MAATPQESRKAGPLLAADGSPGSQTSALELGRLGSEDTAATNWVFWYPTWDAWKFTRTITYWISVMYLEGSILFSVGAAFSMTEKGELHEKALVATPYFMGGICFTLGSYLGVLEALNAQYKGDRIRAWCVPCRRWRRLRDLVHWRAVVGYGSYTVGALFFNVNTIAGYISLTDAHETIYVWVAGTLGSLGFLVGSVLECYTNKVWQFRLSTSEWWLSVMNFLGSSGFLMASLSGLFHAEDAKWLIDFPYVVGSLAFMFGALFTLWLWKCEQYGLGFMPEINVGLRTQEPSPEAVMSLHEEYGCGRASAWQLPFLTMYLMTSTASVLNVGLAVFYDDSVDQKEVGYEVFEAVLNFALSHGVMLLGSVVHHIPTARPHSWLLIYMRIVLMFYFVNSWLNVWRHINNAT